MDRSVLKKVIALCGMAGAAVGIVLNSMGVFYTPVAEGLGVKVGTVSFYSTISMIAGAIFVVIFPRLLTSRNFRAFLYGGMLTVIICIFMMSFATKVYHFYILAALMAMGNTCFSLYTITALINSSVSKNIGTMTGIVFSFSGVAGAISSPVITAVINRYGWNNGYRAMAALVTIFLIPSLFAGFELNTDGGTKSADGERSKFRYDGLFVSVAIVYVLGVLLTSMPQHFVGFAGTRGLDSSVGALMLSTTMIGNISFKLVSGIYRDKTSTKTAILTMIAIAFAGLVILIVGSGKWMLLVGAFLLGADFSVGSVLAPILIREVFGLENYKYTYPVACFFGSTLIALALSSIGYVYDFTGSYVPSLVAMAAASAINILIILRLPTTRKA
ncbi:MAG: MFS transporter [Oscillospiraceae bacterium]|nr:MFS transporter [Oscillospiraceae bacterium]MBR2806801.1 MFS transporter [Oscillospiraceae bacterium]